MKSFVRSSALIACAVLSFSLGLSASAHAAEGDMLRMSQQRLADLGYYTGRYDGMNGPMTTVALRDFQANNGLPVTGLLTSETFNLLISMDYKLYQGGAVRHVVYADRDWRYINEQPAVVHYVDGTAAFGSRYVAAPATAPVAYYTNRYDGATTVMPAAYYTTDAAAYPTRYVATPGIINAGYFGDVAPTVSTVSYDTGCYVGVNHTWHYDDCR